MSDANEQGPAPGEGRLDASAVPWIAGVRLIPGDVVDLVNISRKGVLVEGRTRLVPGTSLVVQLDYGGSPLRAKAKVVRCQVSAITGGVLRYHSGIAFDQELATLDPPEGAAPQRVPAVPSVVTVTDAQPAAATPAPPRVVRNRW